MKRKWIPPFLMLFSGAITSIIMLMLHYEVKSMLQILLGVLVLFYIIGCLLKWMLDVFDRQNEKHRLMEESMEASEEDEEEEEEMAEGKVKA